VITVFNRVGLRLPNGYAVTLQVVKNSK